MSSQTRSGRRAVLKDNSWIRRNAEEDDPVDHDPNFGKLVLGQQKAVEDVSSVRKPVEAEKPAVNSGTSFSSLSKRFSGSQELLNDSTTSTSSGPPPASKPPVPAKNPGLKTPNASGFTARVFNGANTSSRTLNKSSAGPQPSVTVSPPVTPAAATSTVKSSVSLPAVKSSVSPPAVQSPTRSESVSVLPLLSKSSPPTVSQMTVTNTKTSSALDEILTTRPAEKPSESPKLSDVSYSPSAVTVNTRYSSQTHSAPLDDLADSLIRSGSVQSVRSQTQIRTVLTESPPAPLQTLGSSSRPFNARDACSVCGNAIAGAERMILEELKISCHTSCFRCAMCRCDLGGLEAGKSLWVHQERVNCSNCFSKIRGQWYV